MERDFVKTKVWSKVSSFVRKYNQVDKETQKFIYPDL